MGTPAYLDTHVVVWLNDGEIEKFSQKARSVINTSRLLISEFVRMELQYLHETGRLTEQPDTIIEYLKTEIGCELCSHDLHSIVTEALTHQWTRDPFDRLITANASLENTALVTKDDGILAHYPHAVF